MNNLKNQFFKYSNIKKLKKYFVCYNYNNINGTFMGLTNDN